MIAIDAVAERSGGGEGQVAGALPFALIAALAVDLLIDGVLVQIGAALGAREERVLTIALTLETLFLARSLATSLTERGPPPLQAAGYPALLSLSVVVGAVGGRRSARRRAGRRIGGRARLWRRGSALPGRRGNCWSRLEAPDTPLLTPLIALYALEGAL